MALRRGVVIGKFYPPHKGHNHLIDVALRHVDQLTVLVCAKADQTIPGHLRAAWLQETHPNADVRVIDDIVPDDDSAGWAAYTVEVLGFVPEYVFTSEDYGDAYAYFMGSRHVLVDRQRLHVPCSGTLIRHDPLNQLHLLAPCVRAYFVKRICVVGAESTGTTTLAQDLAQHFRTVWVPEYGRFYYEGKMYTDVPSWNTQEFVHIATMQNQMEDQLARCANKVLICDTNALATTLWHERYVGQLAPAVQETTHDRHYDLYLLTGDEIPFVQDGTRDGEHIRHHMHGRFVETLQQGAAPFSIVTGSPHERLAQAVALIEQHCLSA